MDWLGRRCALKQFNIFPASFGILRRFKVYFNNKFKISSYHMSNRTDFGLMHLLSPPHCLSSSIWEEKITFLARLQSFLCCPATSFPPHLQQEALIWVCLPPSYWQALHHQAPPISFAAFAFGQNWPMSSRVTAEKLTDGQTDGMHKKTYSRYFYFFLLLCFTPLHHSFPTISFAQRTRALHFQLYCPPQLPHPAMTQATFQNFFGTLNHSLFIFLP